MKARSPELLRAADAWDEIAAVSKLKKEEWLKTVPNFATIVHAPSSHVVVAGVRWNPAGAVNHNDNIWASKIVSV